MGEKGRVERSRVKLAKNNLILDRFYYTEYSTYSFSLSLNSNGPLGFIVMKGPKDVDE